MNLKRTIVPLGILFVIGLLVWVSHETLKKVSRETKNDDEIPKIRLFVSDASRIQEDCASVKAVSREITAIDGNPGAELAVRLLLNDYVPELKPYYRGLGFNEGIVIVNFTRPALKYLNSAACMQTSYKAPIEATILQFGATSRIEYAIDGEVFDEWDA